MYWLRINRTGCGEKQLSAFAREVWRLNPAVTITYGGIADAELRQMWLFPVPQHRTFLEVVGAALEARLLAFNAATVRSAQALSDLLRRLGRKLQ
jgi:hypothetical protein